jgi:hypothetical protein
MPSGLSNSMLGYGPRTPQDYPGLEQEFNSLQAQSEACETYIGSQRHQGWVLARTRYDVAGSRAALWSDRRCKACSPTSGPGGSTSSSRSTGTRGHSPILPGWSKICGHDADNFPCPIWKSVDFKPNRLILLVRARGLEPPRPYGQQILSLPRLPFRHARRAAGL